jgi:hypothetical protein
MIYSDEGIELEIARLEAAITVWAKERDLWFDCGFTNWLDRYKDEPSESTPLLVMWADGPMYRVWNGELDDDEEQFRELLQGLGYWYENYDGVTIHLQANDEDLGRAFDEYTKWRWICKLVKPDIAEVYEELFAHFARRPQDLQRLPPRDFEILLSRVFQGQGFRTELGPGSGDGGVDVRVWLRDPIGDMLTLVQAKRYASTRSIELEAVSALSGVVEDERASRGLLVTTSRFLPSSVSFAARQNGRIVLADSQDVARWCSDAANCVIEDKSTLVSLEYVRRLIDQALVNPSTVVVHSQSHRSNSFCLKLKESRHAVLLLALPKRTVSGQHAMVGTEAPILDPLVVTLNNSSVFRALRKVDDGRVTYWGRLSLYSFWDGRAKEFDYMD